MALSLSDDYEVIEATDALQGLACRSILELIDLLFSDIVMPGGMDGVQLAEAARKLRPDLKILLNDGIRPRGVAVAEYRYGDTDPEQALSKSCFCPTASQNVSSRVLTARYVRISGRHPTFC